MVLWFLGGALVIVWNVFHDPRFDYRLLMLGAVLPDLIDGPAGGARAMHAVTTNVAMLVVVMLATIGRRPLRRRLLAVPIGALLHLVLDGVFADTRVFWWPFTGTRWPSARLPSAARGAGLTLLLEAAGLAMLIWAWHRFELARPDRRHTFLRTGALVPTVDALTDPSRR